MPAISQKGRRQSDEKATLIYYQKNKNKNKNTPLNFTAFRALRESQRMILNGGKKAYNVKLCPFPFWNYLPMIKKKKNQTKNSHQSWVCDSGKKSTQHNSHPPLSRKDTKVI